MQESASRDAHDAAPELPLLLLDAPDIGSFFAEVARRAAGLIEPAHSCGITVRTTPTSPILGGTSDDLAGRMDEVQYATGDGPCLTCLRDGASVSVGDIRADRRWPAFADRGAQEGAGSSLSVPLVVHNRTVGALNLYSRAAHALTATDRARAARFADQTAAIVALAARLAEHRERGRHLEVALGSRSTIDQAMGVLMAQARVGPDEAFEILRRRSQDTNVKLRDVAAAILAEVTRQD